MFDMNKLYLLLLGGLLFASCSKEMISPDQAEQPGIFGQSSAALTRAGGWLCSCGGPAMTDIVPQGYKPESWLTLSTLNGNPVSGTLYGQGKVEAVFCAGESPYPSGSHVSIRVGDQTRSESFLYTHICKVGTSFRGSGKVMVTGYPLGTWVSSMLVCCLQMDYQNE